MHKCESWSESVGGLIPFVAALQQVGHLPTASKLETKRLTFTLGQGHWRDQLDADFAFSETDATAAGAALRARVRLAAGFVAARVGALAAALAGVRVDFLAAGLAAVLTGVLTVFLEGVLVAGLCDSF